MRVDELYILPLHEPAQRQKLVDVKCARTIQHEAGNIILFEHLFENVTVPGRAYDRLEAPRAAQVDGDRNSDVLGTFRVEDVAQNNNPGWHGTPVYQNHCLAGQGKKRRDRLS